MLVIILGLSLVGGVSVVAAENAVETRWEGLKLLYNPRLLCDPSRPFWAYVCAPLGPHILHSLWCSFCLVILLDEACSTPTWDIMSPVPSTNSA
jgi:hypothetical protein